jgi:purine-binding chemotaxis protein CheW
MMHQGGGNRGGTIRERLHAMLGASTDGKDAAYAQAVLRLRAKRLAAPRTHRDDRPQGTAVLCFRIGNERYGLPLDGLCEVMPLAGWTPVPGLPQHLLGVMNVRGEIRPVLDLHAILTLAAPDAAAPAYVVFLDHLESEVGLRVDELDRIRFIDTHSLTLPHESGNGLPQRFIAGITPDTMVLLDARQILALDVLQDPRAEYRRVS